MDQQYEYLVVGGGLGGVFAAANLSNIGPTALAEKSTLAAGASGAAVGLINPFMGRKARTVWRHESALDGFEEIISTSGAEQLVFHTGVWRPAASAKQAGFFLETADAHPDQVSFLSPDACSERYPVVSMPHGALLIHTGSWTDIPTLLQHIADHAAEQKKLTIFNGYDMLDWTEEADAVRIHFQDKEDLRARHVVLAMGYGIHSIARLETLDLHDVKGQAIRIGVSRDLCASIPCISGTAHIIPLDSSLMIGSTYEHEFPDLKPTPEGRNTILEKATQLVPNLVPDTVEWEAAGARVTVPGTRLPMLDRIPESNRVWIFTGLGTKGILMAALLSREIAGYISNPGRIPEEIRTRTRRH